MFEIIWFKTDIYKVKTRQSARLTSWHVTQSINYFQSANQAHFIVWVNSFSSLWVPILKYLKKLFSRFAGKFFSQFFIRRHIGKISFSNKSIYIKTRAANNDW